MRRRTSHRKRSIGCVIVMVVGMAVTTGTTSGVAASSSVPPPPPPPPPPPVMDYYTQEAALEQEYSTEADLNRYSSWSATVATTTTSPSRATSSTGTSTITRGTSVPRTPIHYEFPVLMQPYSSSSLERDENDEATTTTRTTAMTINQDKRRTRDDDSVVSSSADRASPRQDLITRYMSTQAGKINVHVSATFMGGMIGMVVAKVRGHSKRESRFLFFSSLISVPPVVYRMLFLSILPFPSPYCPLVRRFGPQWVLVSSCHPRSFCGRPSES